MRYFLYSITFLLVFFLFACQKSHHNTQSINWVELPAIDTNNAEATYQKIKNDDPRLIDSLYSNLLSDLSDSNRYELLQQHIFYYEQLSGKRKFAKAYLCEAKGFMYEYFTKYDSALLFFDTSLFLSKELNSLKGVAESYYGKGIVYLSKEDYADAIDNNYKALAVYEQLKDSNEVYRIRTNIAVSLSREKDYNKAIATIQPCLIYYQAHKNLFMISYNESILSGIYSDAGDYQKALDHALVSLNIRRQIGSKVGIAESLNNLAMAYSCLKQWDKAIPDLEESIQLQEQLHMAGHIPIVKQNLANCYIHMGNMPMAEKLLMEAIPEIVQLKKWHILSYAYKNLSDVYKAEKKYDLALDYYTKYKEYNDTVFNKEKTKIINELNIKYETSKKEAQIVQLNADKKVDAIKKVTYLIVLFFTVIIAILTNLYLRSRNKKNKLIIEKVKTELEHNKKELQQFTDSIIGKNKLIEELEQKLQTSVKEMAIEENSEQLSELYQLKILTEDDWRQFKILFDKVYPGFINKLREKYPELAPAEERQFLLIKLKIATKECADMLGISALSVKKNRYRLKKRFNLSEQDDLDAFVWKFGVSEQ